MHMRQRGTHPGSAGGEEAGRTPASTEGGFTITGSDPCWQSPIHNGRRQLSLPAVQRRCGHVLSLVRTLCCRQVMHSRPARCRCLRGRASQSAGRRPAGGRIVSTLSCAELPAGNPPAHQGTTPVPPNMNARAPPHPRPARCVLHCTAPTYAYASTADLGLHIATQLCTLLLFPAASSSPAWHVEPLACTTASMGSLTVTVTYQLTTVSFNTTWLQF